MSTKSAVHRPIFLTSPHLHGEDIEVLQVAMEDRGVQRGLGRLKADGDWGAQSRSYLINLVDEMGGSKAYATKHGATETYQKIIRQERQRPDSWLKAAKAKEKERKAAHGADDFLDDLRRQIGVSNRQKAPVLTWCHEVDMGPNPWCAAVQIHFLRAAGVPCDNDWRFVPNWLAAARAGEHGWRIVTEPRPGDMIFYKWPGVSGDTADHIGAVETVESSGRMADDSLEGNTSGTASGSQHNGDAFYRKDRNGYGVVAYARPPWKR